MVAIVLKYKSINIIVFYYCTYSRLLDTMELLFEKLHKILDIVHILLFKI